MIIVNTIKCVRLVRFGIATMMIQHHLDNLREPNRESLKDFISFVHEAEELASDDNGSRVALMLARKVCDIAYTPSDDDEPTKVREAYLAIVRDVRTVTGGVLQYSIP